LAFSEKMSLVKFVNSDSKNTLGTADELHQTASKKNGRFLRVKYFKIWPFSPYGQNNIREINKKRNLGLLSTGPIKNSSGVGLFRVKILLHTQRDRSRDGGRFADQTAALC